MDILVQADGLTLTTPLRDTVEEKIGRLEHSAPRALRARVRIRKSSAHANQAQYLVSVLVELPGQSLSAEQIGPEPLLALDFLTEKITRRLEKHKTGRIDKRVRGTSRAREKA